MNYYSIPGCGPPEVRRGGQIIGIDGPNITVEDRHNRETGPEAEGVFFNSTELEPNPISSSSYFEGSEWSNGLVGPPVVNGIAVPHGESVLETLRRANVMQDTALSPSTFPDSHGHMADVGGSSSYGQGDSISEQAHFERPVIMSSSSVNAIPSWTPNHSASTEGDGDPWWMQSSPSCPPGFTGNGPTFEGGVFTVTKHVYTLEVTSYTSYECIEQPTIVPHDAHLDSVLDSNYGGTP